MGHKTRARELAATICECAPLGLRATKKAALTFIEAGEQAAVACIAVFMVAGLVLIRVVNPAYPESMMLVILFMNVVAPFIDYVLVQANLRRRQKRRAQT